MRHMKGDVGRRVRELRLKRELTQAELGKAAGVTGSAIKELEAGRSGSSSSLHRIAKALGTTPEQLEGQRGAPAPSEGYKLDLMESLITEVESAQAITKKALAPALKAAFIVRLYRAYEESGERPSRAIILEFLRQAS